jgi:Tol biopolymer transport system component
VLLWGVIALAAARSAPAATDAHAAGAPAARAQVRFVTAGEGDLWPCFSADDTHIVFSRRVGAGWALFLVPVDGGAAVPLASPGLPVSATRANWSTRNQLIAFTGESTARSAAVWLVKPDGSDAHAAALPMPASALFYPSWYPDGRRIAVMDGAEYSIKRIDLEQRTVVTLTDPRQVYTGRPSVSPDGRSIAFAGQENHGQPYDQTRNAIWLLDETGTARPVESKPAQGRSPAWSPGGGQLLFESNRAGNGDAYAIFVINRDGTGIAQLTDAALNAVHPVWSHDGRHIAFSAAAVPLVGRRSIGLIEAPAEPRTRPDARNE